ncbi:hypothetical protein D3C86_1277180 [compost metagenome]
MQGRPAEKRIHPVAESAGDRPAGSRVAEGQGGCGFLDDVEPVQGIVEIGKRQVEGIAFTALGIGIGAAYVVRAAFLDFQARLPDDVLHRVRLVFGVAGQSGYARYLLAFDILQRQCHLREHPIGPIGWRFAGFGYIRGASV